MCHVFARRGNGYFTQFDDYHVQYSTSTIKLVILTGHDGQCI